MIKTFVIIWIALAALPLVVRSQQTYEEWRRRQQAEYLAYGDTVTQRHREFLRADSTAFTEFREAVLQRWDLFVSSTRESWVEYADDLNSRTAVDFEKGEVTVEVLATREEEEMDAEVVKRRLWMTVRRLVEERGKTMDYEVADEKPKPLREAPVLAEQLKTSTGETVTSENADKFATEIVEEERIQRVNVDSRDGLRRVRGTVTFRLVPDHLRIRAEKYLKDVQTYSERYAIDLRLVFAVMHTESYFNPKAKSSVPAYGLMQLVPVSGGREAYLFVHGQDAVPTANYLYNPTNNIELGCAYLNILWSKYFGGIEDPDVGRYCVISGYNTGPGNVSEAIVGEKRVERAVRELRKMAANEVYRKLLLHLPYEETREYLQKVEERIPLYDEWGR